MASPRDNFLPSVQTLIGELLRIADAWSALSQEYSTFGANQIVITDADAARIKPGLTAAQLQQTLAAMQWIVDMTHSTATTQGPANVGPKLYLILK